jgi:RHS repeat-associated protein
VDWVTLPDFCVMGLHPVPHTATFMVASVSNSTGGQVVLNLSAEAKFTEPLPMSYSWTTTVASLPMAAPMTSSMVTGLTHSTAVKGGVITMTCLTNNVACAGAVTNFTAVDVGRFTLTNCNCTCTSSWAKDETQDDATPSPSLVEVMIKTNGNSLVGLMLESKPEGYSNNLAWKVGNGSKGYFAGDGIMTQVQAHVTAGVATDVQAWFDCDHDMEDPNDEPRRKLQVMGIRLDPIELWKVNPAEKTGILGFGETGIAKANIVPAGRALVWECLVKTNFTSLPVVISNAVPMGNDLEVSIASGSGAGMITLRVRDSVHTCVVREMDVEVGCGSCASCAAGNMTVSLDPVQATINLGRISGGGSAGKLALPIGDLDAGAYRPDGIIPPQRLYIDGKLVEDTDPNGNWRSVIGGDGLKQYRTPEMLVDVNIRDEFGYVLDCYPNSRVGGYDESTRRFLVFASDPPPVRYVIENPDRSATVHDRLKISEIRSGGTNVTMLAKSGNAQDNTWTMTTGNGLRMESKRRYVSGADTIVDTQVRDAGSNLVSRRTQVLGTFAWGQSVVQETVYADPGDPLPPKTLVTSWSYVTGAGTPGYGQVARQERDDGSWEEYAYDQNGRQAAVSRGFKDGQGGSSNVARTLYDYTPHTGELAGIEPNSARTTIETLQGITNALTYRAFLPGTMPGTRVEVSERAASPTNALGDSGNLRTETTYYAEDCADSNLAGRVKSVAQSDGRMTSCQYSSGGYDPVTHLFVDGAGDFMKTLAIQGTVANPAGVAGRTTALLTITDHLRREVYRQECMFDGMDYVPMGWTATRMDEAGHVTNTVASTGARSDTVWGCCGKESETDAQGMQTEYLPDALKRVAMRVQHRLNQPDIFTTYGYDAEGRQLTQTTLSGGLSQGSTNSYDLAGRLVRSSDSSGIVTEYQYAPLTNITIRGGLTNTAISYLDGQAKCTLQNGIIQSWTDYGVNPDGTRWTMSYSGPLGTNSPAWQKTTTDFLGRAINDERPGFGGGVITSTSAYNSKGQLTSTTQQPNNVTTLSEYTELGEQVRSGIDVNTNGVPDLAGPDRVNASDTSYQSDSSGDWWQVRVSLMYAGETATPVTNSIQKTRLTGLGASIEFGILTGESCSTDLLGNQTVARSSVDREARTTRQVVAYPDSTNLALQVTVNGLLSSSVSKTGVQTVYNYDALGRQTASLNPEPRTLGSFTAYNSLGQVASTMDSASNVTTYTYDALGRRNQVTDALTNSTFTAYDAEGRTLATWGATYPVAYEYDDYGRMTAMYTYRGTNSISSYSEISNLKSQMDRTRWLYDEATGLLTNKLYADGQGPSYTYTPDGKLATRTWARGVVTTYSYDSIGQMTNISYSDSTPSVSFAYDRLGRQTTITDGTGTRTFTYNDALQLAAETNVLGALNYAFDSLGRPASFDAGPNYSVRYTFDALGRFSSVSSTVASVSSVASYAYVPGSDLVQGYTTDSGFSLMRAFEPNRNLIASITNRFGGAQLRRFDYTNDEIGRRTQRADLDLSSSVSNFFAYNIRSELEDAAMGTNSFSYRYDPIGNRRSSANSNQVSEITTYAANSLNQYTQITNNQSQITPAFDADGNMTSYKDWTFAWDAENRLVMASNATTVLSFTYDHMSRRVVKVVNGQATQFKYQGWAMFEENTSSATNLYVYGLDLSGSQQGAGTIGGILAGNFSGTTAFYACDANGNVTDLVGTNGDSLAQYQFDPYGNTISKSGELADVNPFRFSTKYTDAETGLLYYGYRYYMPEVGRWVTTDPGEVEVFKLAALIGMIAVREPNLYAFVVNRPLDNIDILGLYTDAAGKKCSTDCLKSIVIKVMKPAKSIASQMYDQLTTTGRVNLDLLDVGHTFLSGWNPVTGNEWDYGFYPNGEWYGKAGVVKDDTTHGFNVESEPYHLCPESYAQLAHSVMVDRNSSPIYDLTPSAAGRYNCTTWVKAKLGDAGVTGLPVAIEPYYFADAMPH